MCTQGTISTLAVPVLRLQVTAISLEQLAAFCIHMLTSSQQLYEIGKMVCLDRFIPDLRLPESGTIKISGQSVRRGLDIQNIARPDA